MLKFRLHLISYFFILQFNIFIYVWCCIHIFTLMEGMFPFTLQILILSLLELTLQQWTRRHPSKLYSPLFWKEIACTVDMKQFYSSAKRNIIWKIEKRIWNKSRETTTIVCKPQVCRTVISSVTIYGDASVSVSKVM